MEKKRPVFLNHIAVHVSDLMRSADFYRSVFDLEQIPEPFKLGRHVWFTLGAAGQLHLIQSEHDNRGYDKHDHICFSVASIEAFMDKLKAMKISHGNWAGDEGLTTRRSDGIQQVFFQDPDGHWLEVNDDYVEIKAN